MTTSDLSIGYRSGKSENRLMNNLNLSIPKGKLIALLGANGVGKSTLIRTLANLQAALQGKVFLNDKEVKNYTAKNFAKQVSLVLTDPIQSGNLNVKDLVEMGRYPFTNWTGRLQAIDQEKVENAINLCAIAYLKDANIAEISDGQLQKAMIARALAQDGELMLLDEPTVHLDANNRYIVLELLRKLVDETQKSILISTHQVEIALKMADHIWLANCGEGIISGSPIELIKSGDVEKSFPYLKKLNF
ncbi:ABC transporter ATP-binding protein [Marivirga harenae]|uniref:ABC transporter ATP-binding protein n=1 Tax=Marivirga harenae TaxID=2010992 RepID=UPI0026E069C4|nr:ABC transporter ATP-binding protein [Marivirga harenae]WKV12858.1 ABC transporter ATP-binding protein [Marivirga harenae]|tara:strand:- start:17121 stop:17861 length:741 start_codon:yes stop_codon:yes gene_type:complete